MAKNVISPFKRVGLFNRKTSISFSTRAMIFWAREGLPQILHNCPGPSKGREHCSQIFIFSPVHLIELEVSFVFLDCESNKKPILKIVFCPPKEGERGYLLNF